MKDTARQSEESRSTVGLPGYVGVEPGEVTVLGPREG
jgi:hypothetical protein